MLYDKRWDRTETKPFTLADFIAWLETMPPRWKYDFYCTDGSCLMGLYMAAFNFIDAIHRKPSLLRQLHRGPVENGSRSPYLLGIDHLCP